MQKRLLGFLLACLTLVLSVSATGALAQEVVEYNLWIQGTRVTSANCGNITKKTNTDGTSQVSFDPSTSTLSLNNAKLNLNKINTGNAEGGAVIDACMENLFIKLTGTNSVAFPDPKANTNRFAGIKNSDPSTGNGRITIYEEKLGSSVEVKCTSANANLEEIVGIYAPEQIAIISGKVSCVVKQKTNATDKCTVGVKTATLVVTLNEDENKFKDASLAVDNQSPKPADNKIVSAAVACDCLCLVGLSVDKQPVAFSAKSSNAAIALYSDQQEYTQIVRNENDTPIYAGDSYTTAPTTPIEMEELPKINSYLWVKTSTGGSGGDALGIQTQPRPITVTEGGNAAFGVAATGGTAPYQYQWWILPAKEGSEWLEMSDCTKETVTLSNVSLDMDNYQVRCVVTDAKNASVTSNAATLNVRGASLGISAHPKDTTVAVGGSAEFSVTATGGTEPYEYQWWGLPARSGAQWYKMANFTTANITISGVTLTEDKFQVRCVVTDAKSASVTSDTATLNVGEEPTPTSFDVKNTTAQTIVVKGQKLHMTADVSGGTPPYTKFEWQMSQDDGNTWQPISNTVPSGANADWKVPASLTGPISVRLAVTDHANKIGTSNAVEVELIGLSVSPSATMRKGKAQETTLHIGEGLGITPSDLTGLTVDGNDPKKTYGSHAYSVESGSVKVIFIASYLNTLDIGQHDVVLTLHNPTVLGANPVKISTTLTVTGETPVPKTGDNTSITLLLTLMILAGVGFGYIQLRKRLARNSQ